jgi:hypothetical protein
MVSLLFSKLFIVPYVELGLDRVLKKNDKGDA